MSAVDASLLERFLALAGERLRGDWVVIGGCVLPLRGVEHRVTVDIDVAGPDDAGMDQTLALLGIAEEIGLPVEAINQAAAFVLRRVPGWERSLIEIHRGPNATIHVPDATLFVLLKLRRLTETDLADCAAMLKLARRRGESMDRARILRAAEDALESATTPGKRQRLVALLEIVREPD